MNTARSRSAVFDWAMAIAAFWTVTGLYTDLGWHIRHHVDTFFTPQHAILYSGLLLLFGVSLFGYRRPGYTASLWGIALFAIGGVADLLKHQAFGIEHDFDALVSPTHLLIGFGVAVAICGPVRSALSGAQPLSLRAQLPAVLSLSAFIELAHWITNPFYRYNLQRMYETALPHQLTPDAIALQTLHVYEQGGGLLAMLLQALLLSGPLLYFARRFRAAPGAYAIIILLSNVLIALTNSVSWKETAIVLLSCAGAGLAAELLAARTDITGSTAMCAIFSGAIPAAYNALFVATTLLLARPIGWDWPFYLGAMVQASFFAVLLSFLVAGRRSLDAA